MSGTTTPTTTTPATDTNYLRITPMSGDQPVVGVDGRPTPYLLQTIQRLNYKITAVAGTALTTVPPNPANPLGLAAFNEAQASRARRNLVP